MRLWSSKQALGLRALWTARGGSLLGAVVGPRHGNWGAWSHFLLCGACTIIQYGICAMRIRTYQEWRVIGSARALRFLRYFLSLYVWGLLNDY